MIISRPILIIVINESFTCFQKQYMTDDLISNNRFSGFGQSTGLQRNHYLDDRVDFNQYHNQNDPSKLNQLEDLHDLLHHQLLDLVDPFDLNPSAFKTLSQTPVSNKIWAVHGASLSFKKWTVC